MTADHASNDYHFITRWTIAGQIEEIYDILSDALSLARWWPSVYLDIQQLEEGDDTGLGSVFALFTKGWLPYTLRWQFRVTEAQYPTRLGLEAWGDFVGRGLWTLAQEGETAVITYDWRVRADKPLLRDYSSLFRPIFAANHRWAMEKGQESLRLELARRRATSEADRARVPPPPAPTFRSFISTPPEQESQRQTEVAPLRYESRHDVQAAIDTSRDLSGADMGGLQLAGQKFTMMNLEGADLTQADLPDAVIAAANLEGVDFSGANLQNAVFVMSNLEAVKFREANLRGAKFQMSNLEAADFAGADLSDTLWLASNVTDADFSDTLTSGAESAAVAWSSAATPPADTPGALISMSRWALVAVVSLVGVGLAFFWLRRRPKDANG